MRRSLLFCLAAAVLALCSCGGNTAVRATSAPAVLKSVPTDAVAVLLCAGESDALHAYLGDEAAVSRLDLGKFSKSEKALSYVNFGDLIPLLTVKADRGDSAAVRRLSESAATLGLQVLFEPGEGVLMVSPSPGVLKSSARHLASGHSIMDMPGFADALDEVHGCDNALILFNPAAGLLLDGQVLSRFLPRNTLVRLAGDFAQWTVVLSRSEVRPVRGDSYRYLSNVLAAMPEGGESRLAEVLPASCGFAVSVTVPSVEAYNKAYERYLDASLRLDTEARKGVLSWARDLSVKEVALASWEGGTVVMLRPGVSVPDGQVVPNDASGYVRAMFGDIFSVPSEAFTVSRAGWIINGTEAALQSFLADMGSFDRGLWEGRGCRLALYDSGRGVLSWNGDRIRWEAVKDIENDVPKTE